MVKSIQRGIHEFTGDDNASISISTVDPSKCSVNLNNGLVGAPAYVQGSKVISLTSNTLTISSNYYESSGKAYGSPVAWEIVEFY